MDNNKLIYSFFSKIPSSVATSLYGLIFLLNIPILALLGGKVWYRNSLVYRKICFGLSDFDLSLLIAGEIHDQRKSDLKFILSLLKFTMGRLGEIAIYHCDNYRFFQKFANPLELKRDPHFKNIDTASKAQMTCFMIKMIWADFDKLKNYPELRIERWTYLLQLIKPGEKKSINPHNLLETIKEIFIDVSGNKAFVERFFQLFEGQKSEEHINDYLILHQKLWISADKIDLSTSWEKELLLEIIKWEIWGLYTQRVFENNLQNLENHKVNILKLIPHLSQGCSEIELIKRGLREL